MKSNSRYWPKCACCAGDEDDFHTRVSNVMVGTMMSANANSMQQELCVDAQSFLIVSLMATLVSGLAVEPMKVADLIDGRPITINEERLEAVLQTLEQDVRLRLAEMQSMGFVNDGGSRQ